jgi:tetratricopeptide (TPR) repeat protein
MKMHYFECYHMLLAVIIISSCACLGLADEPGVPVEYSSDGKTWTRTPITQTSNPNSVNAGQNAAATQQQQQTAEEAQKNAAADEADRDGLQALIKEDWDAAIRNFQTALANRPNDETIQQHLKKAQRGKKDAEQAKFNTERDIAVSQLKGIGSDSGLKGFDSSSGSSPGLKGLDDAPASSQLKTGNSVTSAKPKSQPVESSSAQPASRAVVVTDSMTVDGRNVPSGLPQFVEDSIPKTEAGGCVRKGYEAVMQHDWKVALAWFQTALNHEPDNLAWKRLVDLAQFTLNKHLENEAALSEVKRMQDKTLAQIVQKWIDSGDVTLNEALQAPQSEDLKYLFPLMEASIPANDYIGQTLQAHPELGPAIAREWFVMCQENKNKPGSDEPFMFPTDAAFNARVALLVQKKN